MAFNSCLSLNSNTIFYTFKTIYVYIKKWKLIKKNGMWCDMSLKRQEYDSIKDDIVFLTKSFFRIRILISLFNKPATVKELQEEIDLNYPSVLSNINKLELKGYVIKKQEK